MINVSDKKNVPLPAKLVDTVKTVIDKTYTVQSYIAEAVIEKMKREMEYYKEAEAETKNLKTTRLSKVDAQRLIGTEIRYLRKSKKWTQPDLANRCNLHVTQIVAYEKCRQIPQRDNLKILGYVLTGDIEYFMKLRNAVTRIRCNNRKEN